MGYSRYHDAFYVYILPETEELPAASLKNLKKKYSNLPEACRRG